MLFRLRDTEAEPRVLSAQRPRRLRARLALTDEDFEVQVVPFLDDEMAAIYAGRWTEMRESVANDYWVWMYRRSKDETS